MTRLLAFLFALLVALPASAACEREQTAAMRAERDDRAYALAVGAWGLCEEIGGHFAAAHRLVARALEAAPAETTADGKRAPWPALRTALRRLDDRVARVLVTFDGELRIDGHEVPATSGAVLAVDPGRRLFEARRGGQTIAAREVEARAGDLPSVDLRSLDAPSPPEKTRPIGVTERPKSLPLDAPSFFAPALSPRGVAITTAYASFGVAAVAGVVAGVLEAQRQSLASGLASDACPTPDASVRCAQLRQVFDQSRGARNVAIAVGGIGVAATGVAIGVYFGLETKAPASAGITWSGAW